MSEKRREKVIHVENLVIHAKNVDFIRERNRDLVRDREENQRDPWEFLWGRPRPVLSEDQSSSSSSK